MNRHAVRVIKVGGSLLDWPDLPGRLWRWLQRQARASNYLLAGGGELANVIRTADARYCLGEELSHQLCLKLLDVNGQVLAQVLQRGREQEATQHPDQQRSISVLDVTTLLNGEALRRRIPPREAVALPCLPFPGSDSPLPQRWEVTSDSIAAYLAEAFAATELVLLKSTDLSGSQSHFQAAATGFVDPFFPSAARNVAKTRFVNLREMHEMEWILFPPSAG